MTIIQWIILVLGIFFSGAATKELLQGSEKKYVFTYIFWILLFWGVGII